MELNALTRLESLANDLSKLRVRRRVASLDPGEHQSRTLQFFNDDFPRFGGDKSITFFDKTEKSRRRLWHILRILVRRALRRFGKGFMIGASIQVLYVCSRAILSKTSRKALKKPHTLKALGLSKIMQFGSFIGTFLTIFETGMVLNQVLLSRRDSNPSTMAIIGTNSECWATVDQHYDSLLSKSTLAVGGLAGLSLWLAPRSYHTPLAIFFGIRGLEIASKLLCEKGYLPSIPHSDILLMSLSSSQVLFAWLFKRESLDSAYAGFIDYQSGTAKPVYNAYRQAMMGEPLSESTLQVLNEHRLEKGLKPFIPESMSICSILHPECENCLIAACVFAVNSLRRTVPVYVPVYFIPLFAFRTKKVLEDPWYTALHTILGIVRSAAFLSSFSAIAWLTSCLQTNLGFHSTLTGYVAGLFAGTAVALEKKPRRIEISLYTLSRALTSIHYNISRFLASKDIVIRVPELNIICFAFTSALFCHTFVWRPALLRPGYYLLLKWMIGSGVSNILSQEDNEISDGESSTSSEEVDLVK